jgi:acyl-CoA dehydrogenase
VNFELDDHYRSIQEQARAAARAIEPFAVEADEFLEPHPQVVEVLRGSRLCELVVPATFGGRHKSVDPLAVALVREQLMTVSTHADSLFALQGIGSYALVVAGSDAMQQRWLPGVASLEVIAGFALTEEGAGSDAKAMTTVIAEDGDEVVVNGEKTFISNGGHAGFYTVVGVEAGGFSTVLVPGDAPGLETEPTPNIMAPHILGTLRFDDVRLPADHRIGEKGRGFANVLATLAVFRTSVAAAAVGLAQTALDEMTRHARHREQFGRPLAKLGPIAQMLATAWADVESARLLTYRAATIARDDPDRSLPHASMAKVTATETATRVVDIGVQVMGRWGLIRDSRMERLYRANRPMRIYEGATEVLRLGIAQALVQQSADADEVSGGDGA